MRPEIVDRGAGGDDPVRAYRTGLAEDSALHAGDVADFGDTWRLEQSPKIVGKILVLIEPAQVALVTDIVAWIETYQAWKQPPVRLGFDVAAQIALFRKLLLQAVQGFEQKL